MGYLIDRIWIISRQPTLMSFVALISLKILQARELVPQLLLYNPGQRADSVLHKSLLPGWHCQCQQHVLCCRCVVCDTWLLYRTQHIYSTKLTHVKTIYITCTWPLFQQQGPYQHIIEQLTSVPFDLIQSTKVQLRRHYIYPARQAAFFFSLEFSAATLFCSSANNCGR
jgi:hypothetical protein